jgi:hypothetical protein
MYTYTDNPRAQAPLTYCASMRKAGLGRAIRIAAPAVLCVALAVINSGCSKVSAKQVSSSTPYSAVSLDSGAVFFGKLENLGSDYPVLNDVFYVERGVNQQTKQVSNVLIKRGKEWHAPDKMILNARHIVFIEPVTEGSTVAKLIAQSK